MSTWTEVTGIIRCDWISFSYPDKEKVHITAIFRLINFRFTNAFAITKVNIKVIISSNKK